VLIVIVPDHVDPDPDAAKDASKEVIKNREINMKKIRVKNITKGRIPKK
jgi:hypothetical protein